jgi:hypothetical protein
MALNFKDTVVDAAASDMPAELTGVLDYWRNACDGRFAPAWNKFHLDEVDPAVVPRCTVVDVIDGGRDFVYRFWGTARVKLHQFDMTGKSIFDFRPEELAESAAHQFNAVLASRRASWFTVVASGDAEDTFTFWFLRLPISDDGETVNKIVSFNFNRHSRLELEALQRQRLSRRA